MNKTGFYGYKTGKHVIQLGTRSNLILQWQQLSLWWIQFKTSMHDTQKKKTESIKYIWTTTACVI